MACAAIRTLSASDGYPASGQGVITSCDRALTLPVLKDRALTQPELKDPPLALSALTCTLVALAGIGETRRARDRSAVLMAREGREVGGWNFRQFGDQPAVHLGRALAGLNLACGDADDGRHRGHV